MAESLRQKVTAYIARHALMRPGDRVGVAVSGGADSTALLRLLLELRDELGLVLSVVHFHHKLRGADADADEEFVRDLAERYGLALCIGRGDVQEHARRHRLSLEAAARQLRYGYFRQLLSAGTMEKMATAHTRDDQAETVLLRLLRGAGPKGLVGIYPRLQVAGCARQRSSLRPGTEQQGPKPGSGVQECRHAGPAGVIVRPLLEVSRQEIEQYLCLLGQNWREDLSNVDVKHTRNRIRHVLLPVLEQQFNPGIRQVLGNSAEIARAEEEFWAATVAQVRPAVVLVGDSPVAGGAGGGDGGQVRVLVERLSELPTALQRRLLRSLAEELGFHVDFEHVEAVLAMTRTSGEAVIELPGNWVAERKLSPGDADKAVRAELVFRRAEAEKVRDYEYGLPVPGEVQIQEAGLLVRACQIAVGENRAEYNPGELLSPKLVGSGLVVRNWRPGDRFWPAHTKSVRKVKDLLQARHISGRERALWPVVVHSTGELVWMRGFTVPTGFAAQEQDECALLISAEALSAC